MAVTHRRRQRPAAPRERFPRFVWVLAVVLAVGVAAGWFAARRTGAGPGVAPQSVEPALQLAVGAAAEPTEPTGTEPAQRAACSQCSGFGEVLCPACRGGTTPNVHLLVGEECTGFEGCRSCGGRDKRPTPTAEGLQRLLSTLFSDPTLPDRQNAAISRALSDGEVQRLWWRADLRGAVGRAWEVRQNAIERALRELEADEENQPSLSELLDGPQPQGE